MGGLQAKKKPYGYNELSGLERSCSEENEFPLRERCLIDKILFLLGGRIWVTVKGYILISNY